ncbi:MAG: hypothetical protein K9I71_02720 [Ignavibacteriales bacterium]|nr:hypothetical protein [Ignavibacteriales bacterium]MCF8436000.1 hypothetical protein [Ignavibacteriales bacterium]
MNIKTFALFSILLLFIFACAEKSGEEEKIISAIPEGNEYSLVIDTASVRLLKDRTDMLTGFVPGDKIELRIRSRKSVFVKLGYFPDSYSAGKAGFRLFADSLVKDYHVLKGDELVYDNYTNYLVVGKHLDDRPALYSFNLKTKKTDLVWSKWGRKIIGFHYTPDYSSAYFLSTLGMGIRGSLPYVLDARIYFIRKETGEAKLLENLGKGLQLYSFWESSKLFKVNFTFLDTFKTSTLISRLFTYNAKGKNIEMKEQVYELLKDGFPSIPKPLLDISSPAGSFSIKIANAEGITDVFLQDQIRNNRAYLTSTDHIVYSCGWTDDEKYLFFNTNNFGQAAKAEEMQSNLFVVNTGTKMIEKVFQGTGYKNFVIYDNLLIFDDNFDEKSAITFYEYRKDNIYHILKIRGGCGVKNIPARYLKEID